MSILLKIFDLIAAAAVATPLISFIIIKIAIARKRAIIPQIKKLLVLDMSYTLEIVQKRQLHEAITCKDLNGFFSHVWTVHPFATVIPPEREQDTYDRITITPLSPKHTIVEGKIGRFWKLKSFPLLNFLLAQWNIILYLDHLIGKEDIIAVRAGDPYYLGPLGLALSAMHKIPCVFRIALNYDTFYETTGHLAFPKLFRKRWVEKMIEHSTLKRADLVAGGNQDGLNFALKNGARNEFSTVFRVGNLIHSAHFQPPNQRPSAENILKELKLAGKLFSITISRFEPLKYVDDVIRSLGEIRKMGIDLSALLVGDGSMKNELIRLAESLDLMKNVVFAGNRPQEWIASVLPNASVVISPFMGGRSITEACLSAVPVVAYDIEWQSEIIELGKTGELVEFRNWKAIADSVRIILLDQKYARLVGENARRHTLEMMDPAKLSQHEKNEYNKLFIRFYSPQNG